MWTGKTLGACRGASPSRLIAPVGTQHQEILGKGTAQRDTLRATNAERRWNKARAADYVGLLQHLYPDFSPGQKSLQLVARSFGFAG